MRHISRSSIDANFFKINFINIFSVPIVRKTMACLVVLLVAPMFLESQMVDMSIFKGMVPRNIGPAGMSGRVTAIEVD